MTKKLYVVDGSSFIFRAFFALPLLTNQSGLPTNAIYGFNNMLLSLAKESQPDYLAVFFDRPEPSFRKKMYEPYKANRESPPEELVPQFDYIKKLVKLLKIPSFELAGYEADDLIASIVHQFKEEDLEIVIVSTDKDLMQLVNDRVYLYDTMKRKYWMTTQVTEKFGVAPSQVLEILALAGDSSDNIPGVKGIGPKTAAQLVQEFDSLEGIYKNIEKIKGKKREKLEECKEEAFLSKELARLDHSVDLDCALDDLVFQPQFDEAVLEFYEELGFSKIVRDLKSDQGVLARSQKVSKYTLIKTQSDFNQFLNKLKKANVFAFDTETTSLDALQAELVGISISFKENEAYYLPIAHQEKVDLTPKIIIEKLKPIFSDSQIKKYAQNYKYDAHILNRYGFDIQGLKLDTLIASYLLNPGQRHSLDAMALRYFNHEMISFSEVAGKGKEQLTFDQIDLKKASEYAAEDADLTFQIGQLLAEEMQKENLLELYQKMEAPVMEILLQMEKNGILPDLKLLEKLHDEYSKKLKILEQEIYALAGREFNIQSPKQLGQLLFEELKLPASKKTKTGYSTNVQVLTELAFEHELPRRVLDFRSLAKLLSTYIEALPKFINPSTGRIHTSFNQTVAETGRLSSSDPNLQNIPIKSEDGRRIREAFVAAERCQFVGADYSQIELRVLAHFCQDEHLLQAFQQDQDIHSATAQKLFDLSTNKVDREQRTIGKTVNFGIIYGQSAFGLANQLKIPQRQAKGYIDDYFEKFPQVVAFRESVLEKAREEKKVETLFGRRRFLENIQHRNFSLRQMAERMAFNTVIQGTAADLMKMAMIAIDQLIKKEFPEAKLLLQVHDELLLEVPEDQTVDISQSIKETMESVYQLSVPLKVDLGQGANWDEAH